MCVCVCVCVCVVWCACICICECTRERVNVVYYVLYCDTIRRYLEESYIWRVFYQLLLALQECHRKREGVHKVSFTYLT